MAEFVIKLADERGRVQEQVQSAATAEELRQRFSHAGYYVYSVKPRGLTGSRRKAKACVRDSPLGGVRCSELHICAVPKQGTCLFR